MTDVIVCPYCDTENDRDEQALCSGCDADLWAAPRRRPPEAPIQGDPTRAAQRSPQEQSGGAALAQPQPWVCSAPGCGEQRHAADVAECPYCGTPRPAPANRAGAAPERFVLQMTTGQVRLELDGPGPWTIGRRQSASPQLAPFDTVSRTHAVLARDGDGLRVIDHGSGNGTFIDQRRLVPDDGAPLHPGSVLGLGPEVQLRYEA